MRSSLFALALAALAAAQTTTHCNPLEKTCPADPALGGHASFDFKSKSDRFTSVGGEPSYGDDGATFTIAQKGQAPTISTTFYIMFGHVDIRMKASPGKGIVSSAILQSDDLDEIDWEWLGGDNGNVQTNYFGKGITGSYDRAAFHPVADAQGQYHTYGIDWTKDRIEWSIDGNVVRTLTPNDASNGAQYPQTPMNIRIGSWAGGSSDNEGTVEWAGGPTDFSQAPFKMLVQSLDITDYSTGTSYSYSDHSGSWQSIKADGGKIDGDGTPKEGKDVTNRPSSIEQTVSGVSTQTSTATSNAPQETTHEPITIMTTTQLPITTSSAPSIPASTACSTLETVIVTSTTFTSDEPESAVLTSTAFTSNAPESTAPTSITFTSNAPESTALASTTPATITSATITPITTTPATTSPASTTLTSTTSSARASSFITTISTSNANPSSISKSSTLATSASATGTSAAATATASSSKDDASATSSVPPAPVNTANAASNLHIPGAAIALGVLAAFA